jgi:malate dehydrogenase (oxaloacetate-decarboxylating)
VRHNIAQCNNSYIFPGVGLGVIASNAKHVTEKMFMVASEALAKCSPLAKGVGKDLLPTLNQIPDVSRTIAISVGMQAIEEGVAPAVTREELKHKIQANFWMPEYRDYRRRSF